MERTPVNILLGADSLTGKRSGVGRFTFEIAKALHGRPDVRDMRFAIGGRVVDCEPGDFETGHAHAGRRASVLSGVRTVVANARALHDFKQRIVGRMMDRAAHSMAANGSPVVYFEPNMIAKPFRGTSVVNFNDLSWHHDNAFHPLDRIRWIRRNLPSTLEQASRFCAISQFTKDEMVRLLRVPAAMIDVVPLAASQAFGPATSQQASGVLERYGLEDRRFVLSVSTLEPRKNFDGLLKAWTALPSLVRDKYPLVIAGDLGWGRVLVGPEAEHFQQSGHLRQIGHVPDHDLSMLCARCAVFAYVSHYEGFGLPVLEAMQAGAPVIASGTTATAETAGEGAVLVDPGDTGAIALALARIIEDDHLASGLRTSGQTRAASFTWAHTAWKLMTCFAAAGVP